MFRGSWFKKTIDTSHLDRFYLMLGILNAALLLVCGYYSFRYTYKETSPEDAAQPDQEGIYIYIYIYIYMEDLE
ncbi:hypothetical protein ACSQ67_020469 [Phaseolus vulgaris]